MNMVPVSEKELMEVEGGNRRRRAQERRRSYTGKNDISWSTARPYVRNALTGAAAATAVAAAVKASPVAAKVAAGIAVARMFVD